MIDLIPLMMAVPVRFAFKTSPNVLVFSSACLTSLPYWSIDFAVFVVDDDASDMYFSFFFNSEFMSFSFASALFSDVFH